MSIRQWRLPEQDPDQVRVLRKETGLPELVCAVLVARGICTGQQYNAFFADTSELDDPFLLKDMDCAVERIQQAIENGERMAVYGDYDCDGITATALLTSYLQSVGADVIYYVPDREREGYGLNRLAVGILHEQHTDLIITVDNGISAHEEIEYAATLGMDVVVTDHHTPRDTLPNAVAVVNPHRADCPSRFKGLAGVGVAFKLVCALEGASGNELLEYYSDFVALGTVADVVPLISENRTIVRHGLQRILETENPGINALLQVSGLAGRALTGETLAFGVIPRINASGRMGVADDAIELLLTDDVPYAQEVAELVNNHNQQRKKTEEQMLEEIESMLSENPQILNKRILILSGRGWHHGVVGIVSAKLVEKYGRPCILFSIDGDEARGSGRSVEGFSLIEAIAACSQYLTQYGGHTLAAGLSLPAAFLADFEHDLQEWTAQRYDIMPTHAFTVDCILPTEHMAIESIRAFSKLEPFGSSNSTPLFLLPGLRIEGVYPTADKRHIRIRFAVGGQSFYAVFFRMSEQDFPYQAGDIVDALAQLSVGEYNGREQLNIKLRDVRRAGIDCTLQEKILQQAEYYARFRRGECTEEQRKALLPSRQDFALVYKFLRPDKGFTYGEQELYYRLLDSGLDYGKMLIVLDIFEELQLLAREGDRILLLPTQGKANLEASQIMQRLRGKNIHDTKVKTVKNT